jgi:hypothetical protein
LLLLLLLVPPIKSQARRHKSAGPMLPHVLLLLPECASDALLGC